MKEHLHNQRHIFWIFMVALTTRAGYCVYVNQGPYPFADRYREYIIMASRLLERGAILSPLTPDAGRAEVSGLMPPLYVLWVAGIYALFGVESWASTLVLQLGNCVALAGAAALAASIAGSVGGRIAAWTAGLITGLNPALIAHTNYIWDTSFFVFAVTASIWVALRLRQSHFSLFRYLALGGWLGAVALLNPALTLAYPILVLLALGTGSPALRKPLIRGVLAVLVGWALALAPWTIRNYVQLGSFQYVRSGFWNEVWLGIAPEADVSNSESFRVNYPLMNPEEARRVSEVGEAEYLKQRGAKARTSIQENPARFAKLCTTRLMNFWWGTSMAPADLWGSFIPATRQRQIIMVVFLAEFWLIVGASLTGRLKFEVSPWLALIVIAFSLVYALTHVQVRFRAPVEPIVAILLALALAPAWRMRASRSIDHTSA